MAGASRRQLIAVGLLFLAGCSAHKGSLSGTVTFQGKPIVYGTVIAVCSDGISRSANIEPDGSYRFDSLPTGEVKLAVLSPEPYEPSSSIRRGERSGPAKSAPNGPVDHSKWVKIPEEYADPRISGLATRVTAGHSTSDLQLH
jgi:hypothetical protein